MASARSAELMTALETTLADMDRDLPYGIRGIVRHWKEVGRSLPSSQADEVATVNQLCRLLKIKGIPAVANPAIVPDIDVQYPHPNQIEIESKLYYTYFFNDGDKAYTSPKAAGGSQTWKARIRNLVADCAGKLIPKCSGTSNSCGGLLLGFELSPNEGVYLSGNPSHADIVDFMRREVSLGLPTATIKTLSPSDGWIKRIGLCKSFTFHTYAWYWDIQTS